MIVRVLLSLLIVALIALPSVLHRPQVCPCNRWTGRSCECTTCHCGTLCWCDHPGFCDKAIKEKP
jgi:hypothetical protein